MRGRALLVAVALAALLAAALPVTAQSVPDPSCVEDHPRAALEGRCPDPRYEIAFDCSGDETPDEACPVRLGEPGERLRAPALTVAPTGTPRVALAALQTSTGPGLPGGNDASTGVALFLSGDGGRTFARADLAAPGNGGGAPLEVAAAPAPGGALTVAAVYGTPGGDGGDRLVAWTLPGYRAEDAAGVQATLVAEGDGLRSLHAVHAPGNHTTVLAWLEGPVDAARVGAARLPDAAAGWARLDPATAPGPCHGLSLDAGAGRVVAACGTPDGVDLHVLDPAQGAFRFDSRAPIAGIPHVAVTPHGRIGLVTTTPEADDGTKRILFALGTNESRWGLPIAITDDVAPEDRDLANVQVLALDFRPHTGIFHAIVAGEPGPRDGDVMQGAGERTRAKYLAALTRGGGVVLVHDLEVDAADPTARRTPAGNDADHAPVDPDALHVRGLREWVAYTDGDQLVTGELVESGDIPHRAWARGWGAPPASAETLDAIEYVEAEGPTFTRHFQIISAVLAVGIVGRVLLGRIHLNNIPFEPEEPGDP